MAQRGSYAKGVAKREEILRAALEVVAREGYRGASVKQIADAVGLSQAGLLHYFDSKEELFTEILRLRDEVDVDTFGEGTGGAHPYDEAVASYVRLIRHNTEVPGLVHLFSQLAVDATDPQHAAHDFFVDRGRRARERLDDVLEAAQREGRITDAIPPQTITRLLQAVADGMQLQWMLEPEEADMTEVVEAFFTLLETQRSPR
ncbi:TetR/AcrR family transcriptional regulator [Microbacterium sp. SORGH_AS_0888]|uniref:TetR/AcrR family transcriptional regulator n=1 Tax=Microbacterium sp. SORGH_AS_0888 TaxID=3041791 RepID=UPI0027801886|nr:TetR/AcrR family transcriptional regulator [Microbacterium sp. SORGH_AS_0888]MDQ1130339.1 AcrR family transcriptional regulator [Microbacterium sp. SORGH_AS_0888]